jgi:hypothetical protein
VSWLGRNLAERQVARMTDPAAGTLRVTAASYPPAGVNAVYSNYRITGVVSAPGLEPTAVEHCGVARVAKWPQPGEDLPVTVDQARPDRLVINWDQLATAQDSALAEAQAEAIRMRTGLDMGVLGEAIDQTAAGGNAPGWVGRLVSDAGPMPGATSAGPGQAPASVPPPAGPVRHELPPSPATVAVTGRVLAVREVGVPAALAPAGGVVDLTVAVPDPAIGERTAICRASFATPTERERVAAVGTTVALLVDPGDPAIVTLRTSGLPGADGEPRV